MPASSKPVAKRGRPAFKPPRPAAKATKTKSTTQRRKSAPPNASLIDYVAKDDKNGEDNDDDDDDDDDAELVSSLSLEASTSEEPESPLSPECIGTQDAPPTIPPALLTRLLSHFQDDKFRIGKEAKGVVGKYMETFVREAIARAAFERSKAGQAGIGGQFLEVEDLEKLVPQLLLDF